MPLFLSLLAAGLLLSGDSLAAAFYRNLGHLPLLGGLGPCGDGLPSLAVPNLERAVRLQGNSSSAWRTYLRVKGWSDRDGLRAALAESAPSWVNPGALRAAAETLRPAPWAMRQPWTEGRCRAAWDAWTLGLVWAMDGRWSEAVAAYQAGLGMAPGRVPAAIVQEYYLALAQQVLSTPGLSAGESLAAAKYLALAGERAEAADRFQALLAEETLDFVRACQAERWLAWRGDGSPPPDPGACESFAVDPGWAPGWVLDPGLAGPPSGYRAASGSGTLWGLDLDADVLEAGAEVLGTFYWRTSAGQVVAEGFRRPNLWPNSGSSWLRLEGFSTCLPGYTEPVWVSPCASAVASDRAEDGSRGGVGLLAVPSAGGPDIMLHTATAEIPGDLPILYGGWWRLTGQLPQAHVARYGGERSDPRAYYEVVVELGDLPEGEWQPRSGISPGLPWTREFAGWIRPETDVGRGTLEFDGLFCFAGPALE